MNSDEATAGLVAHQILHGHTYAFYWGQDYGGVETYLLALNFAVLGRVAVRAQRHSGHLGARQCDPRSAHRTSSAAAGGGRRCRGTELDLVRVHPLELDEGIGICEANLVFGLILLLQALRIAQQVRTRGSDRPVEWAILGAAAGLGFWASPEIVYFAVPAGVMVAITWRGRSALHVANRVAIVAGTAFTGMAPWIWTTLTSGSTRSYPRPPRTSLDWARSSLTCCP